MTATRPRVLHVDSEFGWRGGQQQVAYLLEAMTARGYATALVGQPGAKLPAYCRRQHLPVYTLAMRGEIDCLAGFRLARLCRRQRFNILHLHSAHALATGLWAKLFARGLKLVGTRRVDFHLHRNPFSRFKYKTPMLDRIVCISDRIRAVLTADGIAPERLTTIHSGVDLEKFADIIPPPDFKRRLGIPPGHLVVGTVAAMADHKDYPNLLQAARIVFDHTDAVSFCAVGDGPEEGRIRAMAKALCPPERFVFTGFREDVGNFLKSFDIFVLASHLEGLGTAILDAQALGLPVVACRTGGIPEAVAHGRNGLLVPARNPQALAQALLDLAGDRRKRLRLGQTARRTVERFAIARTVEKNLALYEALLAI